MLRLKLKSFLRQQGLSEADLADAIADALMESGDVVSERYLRYLSQNSEPLTPSNHRRKPSLVMLGFIIGGLRRLTGKEVGVGDVVEYLANDGGASEPQESLLSSASRQSKETNAASSSPSRYELAVPANPETDEVLDEVWELTVQSLKKKGGSGLLEPVAPSYTQQDRYNNRDNTRPRRFTSNALPLVLLALLLTSLGYIAYEQYVIKPQLLAQFSGLFSLRDRIRPTSALAVPTLIGPEGDIDQLAPVFRVAAVPGALAYEFYIENKVSDDGVYTGPVVNGVFPMFEHTLCPNTTYEWRARALGDDGWTSFSSPLQFRVATRSLDASQQDLLRLADIKVKPATPVMIAPLGVTNTTTPTLEVVLDPDVLGYGFYIRDLRADKIIYSNSLTTEHKVTLPSGVLEDGGIYQWNTRSRNCHYWSDFTPTEIVMVNVYE